MAGEGKEGTKTREEKEISRLQRLIKPPAKSRSDVSSTPAMPLEQPERMSTEGSFRDVLKKGEETRKRVKPKAKAVPDSPAAESEKLG
jgi:hypothetical protein